MTSSFSACFVNVCTFLENLLTFHVAGFKALPRFSYSSYNINETCTSFKFL